MISPWSATPFDRIFGFVTSDYMCDLESNGGCITLMRNDSGTIIGIDFDKKLAIELMRNQRPALIRRLPPDPQFGEEESI